MGGCCHSCRPRMSISDGRGQPVGQVWDPFRCCEVDQQIYDANGALRFTLGPETCLQLGFLCPCCDDVEFPVRDTTGARVARLVKKAITCGECCMKTNRFRIDFDGVKDARDRQLIFAATMLLDLEYFEVKKDN